MGKVKNVVGSEEVVDLLEDLRFDSLLKKKCGKMESFRPSYGSNSKGDEKEIDMKEDSMDSEYEMFLNNLQQFAYDHDHDHEEELEIDPNYKMFLENLKQDVDGESYSVEILMSSGITEIIRYEGKEEGSFRKRNFKSDSKRVNVPSEEIKTPVNENKVKEKAEVDFVSCKSSGEPSKKMNCDMIDESWAQLLDSLDKPGNNMELSHESDDKSIHRKNDGSCSDLEIFELDNIPLHEGGYTPFVTSKCFQSLPGEESWDSIRTSNPSQFREKLMDRLKIPYDRLEFEKLWREVTYRKPVQGVRELRHGRMKPYPTKTNGKSYLDWYKELGMKIDEFRHDRRKILYLLRGFFFWLENTSHEGAFQPWLDSLYLKALG